jgi:cell division protease FtsH
MVSFMGMSSKIGNVSYYDNQNEYQFTKPYSEHTAKIMDEEIRAILDGQYARAKQILREHKRELDLVAEALLVREALHRKDVEALIGKRPYDDVPENNGEKAASENHGSDTLHDKDLDADADDISPKLA